MIAVQLVKYGYQSDIACPTTEVLLFSVYTMPAEVQTYRAFAPILYLGTVDVLKYLKCIRKMFAFTNIDYSICYSTVSNIHTPPTRHSKSQQRFMSTCYKHFF